MLGWNSVASNEYMNQNLQDGKNCSKQFSDKLIFMTRMIVIDNRRMLLM